MIQELYKAVINPFSLSFFMACHNLIYFVVGVDYNIVGSPFYFMQEHRIITGT